MKNELSTTLSNSTVGLGTRVGTKQLKIVHQLKYLWQTVEIILCLSFLIPRHVIIITVERIDKITNLIKSENP